MRVFHGFEGLPAFDNACVAVGSFDGVHRGHRLLIEQLNSLARTHSGQSVVITFDPHPRQVLRGENRLLTTLAEKLFLLGQTGVDNVIVVDFTLEFSRLTPLEFVDRCIVGAVGAKLLVTGEDHFFGHNRGGNSSVLEQMGLLAYRLERFDNISSTMIREAIAAGDMPRVAELLGGDYLIDPQSIDDFKLFPPRGVYLVEVEGCETLLEISRESIVEVIHRLRIKKLLKRL